MSGNWHDPEDEQVPTEPVNIAAPPAPIANPDNCMFCNGTRVSGYRQRIGVNGETYQIAIRCHCSPLTDYTEAKGKRKCKTTSTQTRS